MSDKLDRAFTKQREYVDMLVEHDKFPEYPVDLTGKPGQRLAKEVIFHLSEELFEASFTLKNRQHKLTDDRELDFNHYREEIGDAFAYFVELCLLSGISSEDLYNEYTRKNLIVKQRLLDGY